MVFAINYAQIRFEGKRSLPVDHRGGRKLRNLGVSREVVPIGASLNTKY